MMDQETPIQHLPRLSEHLGVTVYVKRDDLTPIPGGSSKFRKNTAILDALAPNITGVVTNGGVDSNHARSLALLAAQRGLTCDLILHGDPQQAKRSANYRLAELSGASMCLVAPTDIASTIARIARHRADGGGTVAVVSGGGHCREGAVAMEAAARHSVAELSAKFQTPDYVVHASGTGATQAGFVMGFATVGVPVLGVSVARTQEAGESAVREAVEWILEEPGRLNLPQIHFLDSWRGQGYGPTLPAAKGVIETVARLEGLPLDPVYTGKAMAALFDLVRSGRIDSGSTVLFWHTGGLMNLLSNF